MFRLLFTAIIPHGSAPLACTATMRMKRLRRGDLPPDAVALARLLVGKLLVRDLAGMRFAGRIVETEAFPSRDPSSHGFRGPTRRNRSLFLERGHAYVYLAYGSCHCIDVVAEAPGTGSGVLLRALQSVWGIEVMARRRHVTREVDLARGPGRLAAAMGIDLRHDGDLCRDKTLWLAEELDAPPLHLGVSARNGITRARERRLRFYARGNPYVSGTRRMRE